MCAQENFKKSRTQSDSSNINLDTHRDVVVPRLRVDSNGSAPERLVQFVCHNRLLVSVGVVGASPFPRLAILGATELV